MEHARGGFTVVEVIIVLAITGLLFVSAVTLFRGKQGQIQFDQAMYDIESKVQSVVNEVKSGSFEDPDNYTCERRVGNGRPGVTDVPQGTGTNDDCIMLGRAIQAVPGIGTLNIFTVLGVKNDDDGALVTSLKDSNPTPIIGGHPLSTADLTKQYKLSGGATVVSAKYKGQPDYEMAGFYLSPQGGSSAGQGSTFTSLVYPIDIFNGDYENNPAKREIEDCILQAPPTCIDPQALGQWDLCIQNSGGDRRASLSVIGTPGGVTTKLTFEECS